MKNKKNPVFISLVAASLLLTAPFPVFAEAPPPDDAFSFEQVTDWQFSFSSGAGAWGTMVFINPDGSFSGSYHDSNMGQTGDGYPGGTIYSSDFFGVFSEPEMLNDYTAVFHIETITTREEIGSQEIIDDVLYVYTEPYGLENSGDFYMFLPGAPTSELPEDFLSWVHYWDPSNPEDEFLPFYGLYNVNEREGFYGYVQTDEDWDGEDISYIETEIISAEEQAAPLEDQLESGYLNQTELNLTSGEVYQIWDDCLNNIWKYLKENLDADTMSALTDEEIDWIHAKEAAVTEAGEEFEGGSMRPLIENSTAAQWTKERVYELQQSYGTQGWTYKNTGSSSGAVA